MTIAQAIVPDPAAELRAIAHAAESAMRGAGRPMTLTELAIRVPYPPIHIHAAALVLVRDGLAVQETNGVDTWKAAC